MKFLVILLCFFQHLNSAESFAQSHYAKIVVTVADNLGKPLAGEKIWFESKKTGTIYKFVSDTEGKILDSLPGADEYMIVIKGVGSVMDYAALKIPALKPNESYGKFKVGITIDPPKEFTLNNVYFETGKAALKKESFSELDELLEFLQLKKTTVISIDGHTDNVGDDAQNMQLSKARAESVKKYLVGKGIAGDRIEINGFGASRPIADNSTPEGRQENRRTSVRILKD